MATHTFYTEFNDCAGEWQAVHEGYDPTPIDYDTPARNPMGYGKTEYEAIIDLLEQSE